MRSQKIQELLSRTPVLHGARRGPGGTKNGELLAAAERLGFNVLVTIDQGLAYQQNLAIRTIAILVLRPKSGRLIDLLPLAPECLARIESVRPGELIVITS
jgi:hypothetical protein